MLGRNLFVICGVLVVSVVCIADNGGIASRNADPEDQNRVRRWPWPTRSFKCPTMFGAYPDPDDCAYFFACVYKVASRTRCPRLTLFDTNKRVCLPMLLATCDDSTKTTEAPKTSAPKDDDFKCSSFMGTFPHPTDCTKYYSCTMFMARMKSCPKSQLFHEEKKKCLPEDEVDCGSRWNPNDPTTEYQRETTTGIDDKTDGDEKTSDFEETTTPADVEDTTEIEVVTEKTTTERPPQTAPDTDCDEDDVDCIIEDLGETPDWFDCPSNVGGYPHPSSQKLFIFCLNWKPSVKKCGQDLIFSKVLMTCVSP